MRDSRVHCISAASRVLTSSGQCSTRVAAQVSRESTTAGIGFRQDNGHGSPGTRVPVVQPVFASTPAIGAAFEVVEHTEHGLRGRIRIGAIR